MLLNTVILALENVSLVSLIFSKIIKANIDSPSIMHQLDFLIILQNLFIELLSGQQLILFVHSNLVLLFYKGFLCIHNLINIL